MTTYILHQKRKPCFTELTNEGRRCFRAGYCHICGKAIETTELNTRLVLDHDHFLVEDGTGKYRGPAHSICNLNYKVDPKS